MFRKVAEESRHCHGAMQMNVRRDHCTVQCDDHGSGMEQCVDEGYRLTSFSRWVASGIDDR